MTFPYPKDSAREEEVISKCPHSRQTAGRRVSLRKVCGRNVSEKLPGRFGRHGFCVLRGFHFRLEILGLFSSVFFFCETFTFSCLFGRCLLSRVKNVFNLMLPLRTRLLGPVVAASLTVVACIYQQSSGRKILGKRLFAPPFRCLRSDFCVRDRREWGIGNDALYNVEVAEP